MTDSSITTQEYSEFCQYLEAKSGIALGENKQYLVKSRLTPLLTKFALPSLRELFEQVILGKNSTLAIAVIDAMTTNETLWFRDIYPFDILGNQILPKLAKEKRLIKIWSSASASGQEPYSIAITVQELMKKAQPFPVVNILATDVSSTMLENCRAGVYDDFSLNRGLSNERKRLFFDNAGNDLMKVKDSLKNMITVKSQNLLESYDSLGKFDIIFCRNVLIYFSFELKIKVLKQMASSLHSGGYLFLGASESVTGLSDEFEMIRCNPGIVYRRK